MKTAVKQPESLTPRYREVEEILYERIRRGQLKPGDRLESTEVLAQELDVGVGTANQALAALASRGFLTRRPRIGTVVSDDAHVLIDQPSAPGNTAIYGVLVPDLRIPAYAGMVRHMQEILRQDHIHVSIFNIEGDSQVVDAAIRRCIDDDVDALVLVPPLFSSIPLETLVRLQKAQIPVVTCWRSAGVDQWPLVQGDPRDVIATPARHMISKGCRCLALFKDWALADPTSRPAIEPLTVDCDPFTQLEFTRALAEAGLPANPDHMLRVNHGLDAFEPGGLANQKSVVNLLTEWLEQRPQIDGIQCTYDVVAGLTLEALGRLGRKVPDDVAVTGGGNLRAYSWYFAASLTTMDPDLEGVAVKVCELLKAMRDGKKIAPGHVENVLCRLVEGESTARKGT